jgi:hypothetical protein
VFCQRIFKVNPLNAIFEEDAVTARTRVKLYQSGKHHKDFLAAVEKSRETIHSLIPERAIDIEKLQEARPERLPVSSRRREFERILYNQARDAPVDLQNIEEACEKVGIPWSWAVRQIQMLISSGHIIAPKPWQIQLVISDFASAPKLQSPGNVTALARRIGEILRATPKPLNIAQLLEQLDMESIQQGDIEKALDLLKTQGYILKTTQGTYRWTSD